VHKFITRRLGEEKIEPDDSRESPPCRKDIIGSGRGVGWVVLDPATPDLVALTTDRKVDQEAEPRSSAACCPDLSNQKDLCWGCAGRELLGRWITAMEPGLL